MQKYRSSKLICETMISGMMLKKHHSIWCYSVQLRTRLGGRPGGT